jgi:hypothetical protein
MEGSMARKSKPTATKKVNRPLATKIANSGIMFGRLVNILNRIQAEADRQGRIAVSASDAALDSIHNLATDAMAEVHELISPKVETARRNGVR